MDILVPVLLLFPFIGIKRSDEGQNYLSESQTSSIICFMELGISGYQSHTFVS